MTVRSPGISAEWLQAIKSGGTTASNFDYAAQLTGTMLFGNVALRMAQQNLTLRYDRETLSFSNTPAANQFPTRKYRAGWSLMS